MVIDAAVIGIDIAGVVAPAYSGELVPYIWKLYSMPAVGSA